MGSSKDPSLINNVDELGLVYYGLRLTYFIQSASQKGSISQRNSATHKSNET